MSRSLASLLALTLLATPPAARKKTPNATLRGMSLQDRCAIARVLGNQMKDMSEWLDEKKFGIARGGTIDLLVTDGDQLSHEDQMPSIFASGETCEFTLRLSYELGQRSVKVKLATGAPPPLLHDGEAYALLFTTEIERGRRWGFEWPLNRGGYGGCKPPNDAGVSACGGLSNLRMGMPTIRIVVARTKNGKGFEAEQATIDMVRYSEP